MCERMDCESDSKLVVGYVQKSRCVVAPFFSIMVKSNPRAGKGVRMSENMMTPSTPNDRQGCNDNSIAMSGVSDRCRNGYFSEYLRKSAI